MAGAALLGGGAPATFGTAPVARIDGTPTTSGGGAADVGGAFAAQQAAHLTQTRDSRYLPNRPGDTAPTRSGNCGIAATVIALRLAGLDVPGFSGERQQDVLDAARQIATGRNDIGDGTNNRQWARLVKAAGGRTKVASGSLDHVLSSALAWARQGTPVVLSGNAANAWDRRLGGSGSKRVSHFDGAHSVTLSFDAASGKYVINDPLSHAGPFATTADEVRRFLADTRPTGHSGRPDVGSAMAVYH